MAKIQLLKNLLLNDHYPNSDTILIVAAGFEKRCIAVIELLIKYGQKLDEVLVIDYNDAILNEPERSKIISSANKISQRITIFEDLDFDSLFKLNNSKLQKKILIDITGMTRVIVFNLLNYCDSKKIDYDIIYTEAEKYFPTKEFYEKLISNTDYEEDAFIKYLENEKTELVYSYDCNIIQPKEFLGELEPGKPSMLLTFLTFKRSRLQRLLQEFEFDNKLIILSEPVRDDLKWRKEFMKIANYDLIQKNSPNIETLETLYPFEILDFLNRKTYTNKLYANYNLFLAPLGSKMQTIGAYFYWRKHPEVAVIFSQPSCYYKTTYSEDYRDTFVLTSNFIYKNTKWCSK